KSLECSVAVFAVWCVSFMFRPQRMRCLLADSCWLCAYKIFNKGPSSCLLTSTGAAYYGTEPKVLLACKGSTRTLLTSSRCLHCSMLRGGFTRAGVLVVCDTYDRLYLSFWVSGGLKAWQVDYACCAPPQGLLIWKTKFAIGMLSLLEYAVISTPRLLLLAYRWPYVVA
ncbi:hypothetical protein COO60DRAFT_1472974, partial [Scenedesmus sp. NREL 46B-D3]